jgi:hypothetical protein
MFVFVVRHKCFRGSLTIWRYCDTSWCDYNLVLDLEVHADGITAVKSYYTRTNRVRSNS